jgi:5-methylcytosine-specific restriction endonuclease McrA
MGNSYLKDHLYAEQHGICAYCWKFCQLSEWTVDHIKPLSKGGTNRRSNKIGCCKACNSAKADRVGYTPRWLDEYGAWTNEPPHPLAPPTSVERKKPDWMV